MATTNSSTGRSIFFNPLEWFFPKRNQNDHASDHDHAKDNNENNEDQAHNISIRDDLKKVTDTTVKQKRDELAKEPAGEAPVSNNLNDLAPGIGHQGTLPEQQHDGEVHKDGIAHPDVESSPPKVDVSPVQKPAVEAPHDGEVPPMQETLSPSTKPGEGDNTLWNLDNIELGFMRFHVKPLQPGENPAHAMPLKNLWKMAGDMMNFHLSSTNGSPDGADLPMVASKPLSFDLAAPSPANQEAALRDRTASQSTNYFN